MTDGQPDVIIKNSGLVGKVGVVGDAEKLKLMKKELKKEFKDWDGESIKHLIELRHKIDDIESLETRNDFLQVLSSGKRKPKGGQSGQK